MTRGWGWIIDSPVLLIHNKIGVGSVGLSSSLLITRVTKYQYMSYTSICRVEWLSAIRMYVYILYILHIYYYDESDLINGCNNNTVINTVVTVAQVHSCTSDHCFSPIAILAVSDWPVLFGLFLPSSLSRSGKAPPPSALLSAPTATTLSLLSFASPHHLSSSSITTTPPSSSFLDPHRRILRQSFLPFSYDAFPLLFVFLSISIFNSLESRNNLVLSSLPPIPPPSPLCLSTKQRHPFSLHHVQRGINSLVFFTWICVIGCIATVHPRPRLLPCDSSIDTSWACLPGQSTQPTPIFSEEHTLTQVFVPVLVTGLLRSSSQSSKAWAFGTRGLGVSRS